VDGKKRKGVFRSGNKTQPVAGETCVRDLKNGGVQGSIYQMIREEGVKKKETAELANKEKRQYALSCSWTDQTPTPPREKEERGPCSEEKEERE